MAEDVKGVALPMLPSRQLLEGPDRAPARAMLRAVGFEDEDFEKPLIGIANTWTDATPCNVHLKDLAEAVRQGIREAGGTPLEFNTIAVSDGITMGTSGMRASLVSREVIADSIELMGRGYLFDGIVALSGCDKTIPGTVMGLARLDRPSLMLYGGSIQPGHYHGRDLSVQDVFEAVGAAAAGKISGQELGEIERAACPGAGACGGQFTANTMANVFEAVGHLPDGKRHGAGDRPGEEERGAGVRSHRGGYGATWRHGPADPHATGARERDLAGGGDRRLDELGAALARRRSGGRRAALAGRLQPHQRPHACARRHEAVGPFHGDGPARRGRRGAGGQAPARRGAAARQHAHRDGSQAIGGGRGCRGASGPGGHPHGREPGEEARGAPDSARATWRRRDAS